MDNEVIETVKSSLETIQDVAEVANAVASMIVGHRRILVDGGFDPNLVDSMCANLHAKLLDLDPVWTIDYEEPVYFDDDTHEHDD